MSCVWTLAIIESDPASDLDGKSRQLLPTLAGGVAISPLFRRMGDPLFLGLLPIGLGSTKNTPTPGLSSF
ncbi:hypothetical protein GGD83_005060 [Rhodoblastus sphagnicola]|nr:hypothetical protein [Rhodoblastus sphagnicola]